jgi:DNA-binding transcriptional MerR regulator
MTIPPAVGGILIINLFNTTIIPHLRQFFINNLFNTYSIKMNETRHYRIGAVSQATGVPVPTLRVWEQRYRAFEPIKTAGKQRLYGEHDVSKAWLLRQLSQSGHAIGSIAHLDVDSLRQLSATARTASPTSSTSAAPKTLLVVGRATANRLELMNFPSDPWPADWRIVRVFDNAEDALNAAGADEPIQLAVIKLNSLQAQTHHTVLSLAARHRIAHTIVLYHFAPEGVVQALRLSGITVRREPLSDADLSDLIAQRLRAALPEAPVIGAAPVAPRRYSDEVLARVASLPSEVMCECPRHVAELIAQLASFEDYSRQCLNRDAKDAALHAQLERVSGMARAMFEDALEQVAAHEGIDLSAPPPTEGRRHER